MLKIVVKPDKSIRIDSDSNIVQYENNVTEIQVFIPKKIGLTLTKNCVVNLNFDSVPLLMFSPLPYNDLYDKYTVYLPKSMTQNSGEVEVKVSITSNDLLFISNSQTINVQESNLPSLVKEQLKVASNSATTLKTSTENDGTIIFEVNNRTIAVPPEITDIVVQGDTNSRTVSFKMPRYFDGVDLSQKYICINFKTSNGTSNYKDATNIKTNSDNAINFDWIISGDSTKDSGSLSFSVECYGVDSQNNKIYRWQTKPSIINVSPTIQPLNDAVSKDYTLEQEFVSNYDNSTTMDDMTDSDAPIQIVGRDIIMPSIHDITVSQDSNSQIITFTISRFFDGMDLSSKIISIKYINAANMGDRTHIVNRVVSDTEISFGWILDGGVTYKSGTVKFAVEFLGYNEKNEFYSWSTLPAQFSVSQGLDVDSIIEPPSPSWLQNWTVESQALLDELDEKISNFVNVTVKEQIQRVIDEGDRQVARVVNAFSGSGGDGGVSQEDVNASIYAHNSDSTAHNDIRTLALSKLSPTGVGSDLSTDFTTSSNRSNLTSGETLSTSLGKISRYFSDIKNVAYTGSYIDLTNKPTALKSPYRLTFTGAVDKTYDGSEAVVVDIPVSSGGDGGISQEDVNTSISTHNSNSNAHGDIRTLVSSKLDPTGVASDLTTAFKTHSGRVNLISGEKLSISLGKVSKYFEDLKKVSFTGSYNDLTDSPTALKNPYKLTFTGAVNGNYDGSKALEVNIPLSGGGAEWTYYAKTPCRLSGASIGGAKLVSNGECTYRAYSDTVKDMDSAGRTLHWLTENHSDGVYEFTVSIVNNKPSGWYQVLWTTQFTGLEVGKTYKLYIDTTGLTPDSITMGMHFGRFLLASVVDGAKSDLIISTTEVDHARLNSWEFTATTTDIILEYYAGKEISELVNGYTVRFKDLYINYADAESGHTPIFDQSGTFTNEFIFTDYVDKLHYESTPECSVYFKEAKSKLFTINGQEPDSKGNIDIPISHLHGKTLVCFGDSITGMFKPPTDYPSVIAKLTGMTVYNVGMEGCRMSHHPDQYYDAFSMTQLIDGIIANDFTLQERAIGHTADYAAERVETLKSIDWANVDIISIFYGTNDIQGGIPLEIESDLTNESYLGAVRYSLELLWRIYPQIKVLLITPIFRYWDDPVINSDSKQFGNKYFYDYTNGLLDVAKKYKTPALDLYYTSGINEQTCEYYFLPNDGTHPNEIGRELIGRKIAAKLLSEF